MELLKHYIKSTEKELFAELAKTLKEKYPEVIVKENFYIYAKGSLPVMLVAHLDTVWEEVKDKIILYDSEQQLMWSPYGLGADDRAGVAAIMKILKTDLRPSVLFTCGEEQGGIGAAEFVMDYPILPNVDFILELDRQGTRDAVYYRCDNPQFEQFISSFGFTTAKGIFSDISIICPFTGIAGVNLSIGYIDEHSPFEMLFVDVMYATIDKVMNILESAQFVKYKYIERKEDDDIWLKEVKQNKI